MCRFFVLLFFASTVFAFSTYPDDEVSGEYKEAIITIGDKVAMELVGTLKKELKKALSKGGPVGAVSVCSERAQELTEQVSRSTGNGIDVKRTTFRYRNPKNAPDRYEALALGYFEDLIKRGKDLPPYLIQKVNLEGQVYYRYYKPIRVESFCLLCHGNPESMQRELLEKLRELYPEDRATGYSEGDFRGLVRVSIPERVLLSR